MTREDAITLLLDQEWTQSNYGFHIKKLKRNNHLYPQLKEAFHVLKMGYDGDAIGIIGRECENFMNLNVAANQWKRAEIDVTKIKIASQLSITDEIAAIRSK